MCISLMCSYTFNESKHSHRGRLSILKQRGGHSVVPVHLVPQQEGLMAKLSAPTLQLKVLGTSGKRALGAFRCFYNNIMNDCLMFGQPGSIKWILID